MMINLSRGTINLGKKNILHISNYENINILAKDGLIETRKDGAGIYYYVEAMDDGMRFGVFIRMREKSIRWVVLRWLDGPCTSKGWEGVSDKALKDEYRLLSAFVEKSVGGPPDNKKNRQRTWRVEWGQVEVSYEPREFAVGIFMEPR